MLMETKKVKKNEWHKGFNKPNHINGATTTTKLEFLPEGRGRLDHMPPLLVTFRNLTFGKNQPWKNHAVLS